MTATRCSIVGAPRSTAPSSRRAASRRTAGWDCDPRRRAASPPPRRPPAATAPASHDRRRPRRRWTRRPPMRVRGPGGRPPDRARAGVVRRGARRSRRRRRVDRRLADAGTLAVSRVDRSPSHAGRALASSCRGRARLGVSACATYQDDLARGQSAFEASEHERALAIFRAARAGHRAPLDAERAHYAYLRGMTDYRIGYKADARHWLAVAKALERADARLAARRLGEAADRVAQGAERRGLHGGHRVARRTPPPTREGERRASRQPSAEQEAGRPGRRTTDAGAQRTSIAERASGRLATHRRGARAAALSDAPSSSERSLAARRQLLQLRRRARCSAGVM